ncbi:MAG TPA: tRNA (adenosine(37)-N6)-dimethylallyltransferase MiaA [Burkholderiaceae bacterium]|nr:tRNA (adenosine(37)-N6)-dimethylallyltransferase MiaA [Burkholderiaceae bacterium]
MNTATIATPIDTGGRALVKNERYSGVEAVLLLGPTASGKSSLALALAKMLPLEIISIDSTQVYRGLDIGSAKPSTADRTLVPHHLIDLRDPAQPYSVAQFLRDAATAIDAIRDRGRLPLVVGGTMMYARALRQGLSQLPDADPAIRARIEQEAAARGWPALHARLQAIDPETARRLAPADRQRIGRALELFERSGQRPSELRRAPTRALCRLRTIALMPEDRAELHRRIERRFDAMLAQGFLAEVQALRERGDLHSQLPGLRSVGYRQAWEHLERGTTKEQFRSAAIAATRQLAKRQITWLRSMNDAIRIDPFAGDALDRAAGVLAEAGQASAPRDAP